MSPDTKPIMKCSHVANSTSNGRPACVICSCFEIDDKPPSLDGRIAKCSCGNTRESSPSLAFFEFQGEGSDWAMGHCAVCGYAPRAHDTNVAHMARIEKGGRTRYENFMEKNGGVHEFRPRGGDRGYDTYYCGCRGWD